MLSSIQFQQLIQKIKEKKELQGISSDFVLESIKKVLQSEPKLLQELSYNFQAKSFHFKHTVKKVREKLRRDYGLFRGQEKVKERQKIVTILMRDKLTPSFIEELLHFHASTKERKEYYPQLYQQLFTITGKPARILDLGCGLNPLSLPLMKIKRVHYHALDISEEEISLLNTFFAVLKKQNPTFSGKAEVMDITKTAQLSLLPEHDLCFLLKMTDILDKGRGHKMTENVLKAILATYVVISFPTITMGGKKMNFPRRRWIELLCYRLKYTFDLLEFEKEIFYVIKKN